MLEGHGETRRTMIMPAAVSMCGAKTTSGDVFLMCATISASGAGANEGFAPPSTGRALMT